MPSLLRGICIIAIMFFSAVLLVHPPDANASTSHCITVSNGFCETPAQAGTVYDVNGQLLANYGVSTQYQFNMPATQTTLQFYAGLESHTNPNDNKDTCSCMMGIDNLHVVVSGTDPSGNPILGQYLIINYVKNSPNTDTSQQQAILTFLYNALLNVVPYGIGSDIQNVLSSPSDVSSGYVPNSNSIYGDWSCSATACNPGFGTYGPTESGLVFGFQVQLGSATQGTYTLHFSYHIDDVYCIATPLGVCTVYEAKTDLTDSVFYCYMSCTTDFSDSASPSSINVTPVTPGTVKIALSSLDSFSDNVDLYATASDSSLQTSISPQIVSVPSSGTGSSTLTVSVPGNTCKAGTFSVTVDGDNGISHPSTISVSVSCPIFSISVSPTTLYVNPLCAGEATIVTSSLNGFSGTVTLSLSYPLSNNDYMAQFDPSNLATLPPGAIMRFYYWSNYGTPTGTFTATIIGTSGSLAIQTTFLINVDWNNACWLPSGGGSVASGTLITLSDGSLSPVQNLRAGMQVMSYNMTNHEYVVTNITTFYSVVTDNQMVIKTSTGKPLIVDQNPAQRLYTKVPDGNWVLLPVTLLRIGYMLFDASTQTWVPITSIEFQNNGQHVMYDIYTTAPGNYIANGYLDPHKL